VDDEVVGRPGGALQATVCCASEGSL
jgi:hypothetical protein